jgi:hypothetical protein
MRRSQPHKTSHGWKSAEGRGVCEVASPVLTWHCWVTVEMYGRWDTFVWEARRKVEVALHLRPLREQAAGDLESRALH